MKDYEFHDQGQGLSNLRENTFLLKRRMLIKFF